jgi:hypothetical protein
MNRGGQPRRREFSPPESRPEDGRAAQGRKSSHAADVAYVSCTAGESVAAAGSAGMTILLRSGVLHAVCPHGAERHRGPAVIPPDVATAGVFSMIRFAFALAVVASMFIAGTASAEQARASRSSVEAARKGPVAKLIELERRKNEWLRQRFGR